LITVAEVGAKRSSAIREDGAPVNSAAARFVVVNLQ
jgi:hypothetical protein